MAGNNDNLTLKAFLDTSQIDKDLAKVISKSKSLKLQVGSSKQIDTVNKSLGTMLKHITAIPLKMVQWQLLGNAIGSTIGAIRDGVSTVFALDRAMTNINMTMELTNKQQTELKDGAFDTAQAYNTTAESVLRVTQIFSNLSETVETLNSKVETTIALANITGSSAEQMSDAIQGMG